MKYEWDDFSSGHAALTDGWLDEAARRMTGFDSDECWSEFHEYWLNSGEMTLGENYWCKIISESGVPFAAIIFSLHEGEFTIMEYIVDPQKRGRGLGSSALRELIENGDMIIHRRIERALAVIFPCNIASQKAFEKAGFVFDHTHPDGDAWYYKYDTARSDR